MRIYIRTLTIAAATVVFLQLVGVWGYNDGVKSTLEKGGAATVSKSNDERRIIIAEFEGIDEEALIEELGGNDDEIALDEAVIDDEVAKLEIEAEIAVELKAAKTEIEQEIKEAEIVEVVEVGDNSSRKKFF